MLQSLKFSREVNLLLLSILLFGIALGIDLVTFPTLLTLHLVDPAKIGLASTFEMIGGIFASFFLSRFVASLGMMRALAISAGQYALAILLIYFYQNYFLWIALTLFMGYCRFIYVIACQSWLNILATNEQRGIITGIFSMTIAFGLGIGPVIVNFVGASSYFSFVISAFFVIASYFCIAGFKKIPQPEIESERIPLKDFFKRNPLCFLARFFLDFQTYALLTLTVVYGTRIGLGYEAAGLLITAYMSSGFFDVWVGFALKRISPYKMINIGFLGCIYCFIIITLYNKSYLLLVVLYFIFGISIACIYVSVFKIANEDYPKEKLVAANATFQLIGSFGSLVGALFGGVLLDVFDVVGFPITIISGCIFYLTFLVLSHLKKSRI